MEYADLLRRLDNVRGVGHEDFEILCGLEQLLADLRLLCRVAGIRLSWDAALARLRRLAVEVAGGTWLRPRERREGWPDRLAARTRLPTVAEVTAVYRRLARQGEERLTEYGTARLVVPECLVGAVIDYPRYVRAALAWRTADPHRRSGLPVLGLRSGGSYLAPLWAAALADPHEGGSYLTVRPPRIGPDRSASGPPPDPPDDLAPTSRTWPELDGVLGIPPGRQLLIVDDQLGRGATMAACVSAIGRLVGESVVTVPVVHYAQPTGTRPQRTIVLSGVQRPVPPVDSADEYAPRAYFRDALARLSPREGLVLTSVERLPEGYWLRYLSAATGVPWRQLELSLRGRMVRRFGGLFRRYRLVCHHGAESVTLVAKYLGFGYPAQAHAEALTKAPAAPPVLGARHGYLFYRWVPGTPLDFGSGAALDAADLEAMAATVAELHRTSVLRLAPGRTARWAAAACARLRGAGLSVPDEHALVRALAGRRLPVTRAPRNHGYWHWVRSSGGELIRFHREATMTMRHIDPAGDLAAIAIELGLSLPQVEHLVRRYTDRCGDEVVPGRLALGAAAHAALVLAEYDDHQVAAGQLAVPARPSADGLAPFVRRRVEVGRSAVALVRDILG